MEIEEPKYPIIFTINTLSKLRKYGELLDAYYEMNGGLKGKCLAATIPIIDDLNSLPKMKRRRKFF